MTKKVKYTAICKEWKLINLHLRSPLLKGNRNWFPTSSSCVCNCSTIVTPTKALFHVISPLCNLVIAYWTNLVVIVPKAFRTFHDQCHVHIRVLAMFTETFRVKGGGLFRVATFCFLTVVFSVVALSWVPSASTPFSEATSSSSSWFSISDALSSLLLSLSEVFSTFW